MPKNEVRIYNSKAVIFQNEYDVWQFRIWLAELLKQKVELEKQIESAKKGERAEALKTVKKLCKEFGFTAGILRGSLSQKKN